MKKTLLLIAAVLFMGTVPMQAKGDRDALVAIYKALNGPEWGEEYKAWNTNAPLKEWKGVGVSSDSNGEHVTSLKLNISALKGYLPAEVAQLKELEALTVYYKDRDADAAKCIPAEVWSMPELVELNIHLVGQGFAKFPSKIDARLVTLSINKVEGPFDAVCSLTKLRNLVMEDFKGAVPENIGNLAQLKTLSLKTSEDPVGRVPASIGKLANLQTLTIDYSAFIGGPKPADAEFPVEVWDLAKLKYLFLRGVANKPSTIPADKVAAMTLLENVVLCRVGLEGPIPGEFFKSGKMKKFDIYENNMTGTIPAEIGNCPNLTSVSLNRNNLSGSLPKELGNCTKLTTLWVHNNPNLGGKVPETLINCEKLFMFKVDGTKIDINVPESLKAHPKFAKWNLKN